MTEQVRKHRHRADDCGARGSRAAEAIRLTARASCRCSTADAPGVPVSLAESWYPRLHFGWSELRSARVGEWKYIAAPKPELYDLRGDRGERKNLVHDRAAVAAGWPRRSGSRWRHWRQRFRQHRRRSPMPATVERLQALGYVGCVRAGDGRERRREPARSARRLPRVSRLFNRALTRSARKRAGEAAALLQRLVKQNVRAFEAHLYLGNAYAAQSARPTPRSASTRSPRS